MMPAARRDRISELKGLVQGYLATNRCILSDITNPARLETEIERQEKLIEQFQRDVVRMKDILANGKNRYIENDEQVDRIRKEIMMLENEDKIEKLLELVAEVNAG